MEHIINIVEIWKYNNNIIGEIQVFTLMRFIWNHRSQKEWSDHDIIVTFIMSQFQLLIHLEVQDFENQ